MVLGHCDVKSDCKQSRREQGKSVKLEPKVNLTGNVTYILSPSADSDRKEHDASFDCGKLFYCAF